MITIILTVYLNGIIHTNTVKLEKRNQYQTCESVMPYIENVATSFNYDHQCSD